MAGQSGSKAGGAVLEPELSLDSSASAQLMEMMAEQKAQKARQDELEAEVRRLRGEGAGAGPEHPKGFVFSREEREAFLGRRLSTARIFNILGKFEPMQLFADEVVKGAGSGEPQRTPGLFIQWRDHIGPGVDIPMPKWVRDQVVDPMEAELKNSRWSRAERWEIGVWDGAECEEVAITAEDVLAFNLLELPAGARAPKDEVDRLVRPGFYPLAEVMARVERLPKWGAIVVPGTALQGYLRAEYARMDVDERAAKEREALARSLRPGALKAGGM
jgi:hypothetical protein